MPLLPRTGLFEAMHLIRRAYGRANTAMLTEKIDNAPLAVTLLDVVERESCDFRPVEDAAQRNCDHRPIAFSFRCTIIWRTEQLLRLLLR